MKRRVEREARRRAIKASRAAARAQGCVCDVEVVVVESQQIQVRHDDWCPLLRVMEERQPEPGARSQLIIYRPDEM